MTSTTLETIPLLAELPADRLDELAAVCTEIEVEAGATLIQEGDFGYAMFAIVAGTADVVKDGERVRRMQPGDVFGEIAILSGGRRTATVVARTAMTLITVMNRDVWRLQRDAPSVGASLRETIAYCMRD